MCDILISGKLYDNHRIFHNLHARMPDITYIIRSTSFIVRYVLENKYLSLILGNFPTLKKYYKEGRVELEVFQILINGVIIYAVCHIATILGKCYIATISKNLSDDKVKSLSKMMSKDISIKSKKF